MRSKNIYITSYWNKALDHLSQGHRRIIIEYDLYQVGYLERYSSRWAGPLWVSDGIFTLYVSSYGTKQHIGYVLIVNCRVECVFSKYKQSQCWVFGGNPVSFVTDASFTEA